MSLKILLMSTDGILWDTMADQAILPTLTGQVGILPGHIPLVTAIEVGLFRIKVDDVWKPILLSEGCAVVANNELTVLVRDVEEITITLDEANEILTSLTKEASDPETKPITIKEKFETIQKLKRASARVLAFNYLN